MAQSIAEAYVSLWRRRVEPFDDRPRFFTLQQDGIAVGIQQGGLQRVGYVTVYVDICEHDDCF